MNGLIHPTDLEAWRSWHESRHPLRSAARTLVRRGRDETAPVELLSPPTAASVLVCIEATHASVRSAVASTLTHLPVESTAILCPSGWGPPDRYAGHVRLPVGAADLPQRVPEIRAALA
ncbi:MAG: hypothetical protein JWN68_2664, partial [Nocardioides sp.]|nr:hypothetical protein [Nocardioides sp.]